MYVLGLNGWAYTMASADLIFSDCDKRPNESALQQQLQLAQATVFESELFHEVSK
jgi:hypothetical protein